MSSAGSGWRTVGLAWLVSCLVIAAMGLSQGLAPLGLGGDTDDTLRFLQLRDFLGGQAWHDVTQSRLGAEGTPLHWSRLPDLPYLLVVWPLTPLLGVDMALRVAGSLVPFLMWGGVVWAILGAIGTVKGERRLDLFESLAVAVLPALAFAPRFGFGSFDHHNVQLLCLALALVGTLSSPGTRAGSLAGLALAGSALVGLETAPVVVYLCAVWAVWWVIAPAARREASIAFGLSLAASVAVGGGLFAADFELGSELCDAFGTGVGGALLLGGLGVAAAAASLSGRSLVMRLMALAGVGAVVMAFTVGVSPQCLANPLDAMPEDVQNLWLGNVKEARGLFAPDTTPAMRAFVAGVPLIALVLALCAMFRFEGRRKALALVLAIWLALALALTVYQIRFQSLALVPASVVMGAALVTALRWDTEPLRRLIAVVTVAMGSLGLVWSSLAVVVDGALDREDSPASVAEKDDDKISKGAMALCTSEDTLSKLDTLDPGLVLAHFNTADELLLHTRHSALASNYHRGWRDISTQIELERLEPGTAGDGLRSAGIDYVLACAGADGRSRSIFGFEESFLRHLADGVPGLERLEIGLPEGVAVYAVR